MKKIYTIALVSLLIVLYSCGKTEIPTPDDPKIDVWQASENNQRWSKRLYHSSAVFKDKLWVTGGVLSQFGNREQSGAVWESGDGKSWSQSIEAAPWGPRYGHVSLNFKGKLWIIAGKSSEASMNDTWSSTDGVSWKNESKENVWQGRYQHSAVVFDDKIWLLGGNKGDRFTNDIWSSEDGVSWVKVTDASWTKRANFATAVFKDHIWLLGGFDSRKQYKRDVWKSTNGKSWVKVTDAAPWGARSSFTAIAGKDSLYIMGGVSIYTDNYQYFGRRGAIQRYLGYRRWKDLEKIQNCTKRSREIRTFRRKFQRQDVGTRRFQILLQSNLGLQ